ncbi:hypothetical protein IFM89_001613 [Coptis chinensis]|uniref:Serine aminopeptidase S33 domain-containing protein n=1 Tax=Coptis chinensis TaxID=261450 RepID=A0A835HJW7_9MAGN|nr:hypothetical protein IFM89_001613 [Coptis chinensis]
MAALHSTSSPNKYGEKLIVENKYGEKLVGVLHDTGSPELVILCHGFRSTKEDNTMKNLAAAITKAGVSAFRFDFAGNGESEGSFQFGNYIREADDLRSVVEYFSGGKHAVITILGHSKDYVVEKGFSNNLTPSSSNLSRFLSGGNVVLLYASRYHDAPAIVNVSGRYNLKKGIVERFGENFMQNIKRDGFFDVMSKQGEVQCRITEESLMERLGTDMHAACLSIEKSCRVLTVHGSMDEVIPVEDAFEFAKIIPNHKLHIIEGSDHNYSGHQAELAEVVLNFIKASIQK